jgi:hypothetical protein
MSEYRAESDGLCRPDAIACSVRTGPVIETGPATDTRMWQLPLGS